MTLVHLAAVQVYDYISVRQHDPYALYQVKEQVMRWI